MFRCSFQLARKSTGNENIFQIWKGKTNMHSVHTFNYIVSHICSSACNSNFSKWKILMIPNVNKLAVENFRFIKFETITFPPWFRLLPTFRTFYVNFPHWFSEAEKVKRFCSLVEWKMNYDLCCSIEWAIYSKPLFWKSQKFLLTEWNISFLKPHIFEV